MGPPLGLGTNLGPGYIVERGISLGHNLYLFLRGGGGGGWDTRFRYFRLTVDSRSFNAQPFKCPKLRNNLFGEARRTYKDEEKRQFFLKKDSQYIFF